MAQKNESWWKQPWVLVEAFTILNLGFLAFDIFLAHSVNDFRRRAEYIPLYFSAAAPPVLLISLVLRPRSFWIWKYVGCVVGWLSIVVGLTGVILHLDSAFFYDRTIRSLTYAAPFAAPWLRRGAELMKVVRAGLRPGD